MKFDGLIACPISGGSFLMSGARECFGFINILAYYLFFDFMLMLHWNDSEIDLLFSVMQIKCYVLYS